MDEKLTAMAECTVFAGCSRRQLTLLGRQFEVVCLRSGTALPAGGPAHWLHLVLEGRVLGVVEGQPDRVLGEGAGWTTGPSGGGRSAVIALTDVVVASVAARALGALDDSCPAVSEALRNVTVRGAAATSGVRRRRAAEVLVAAAGAHDA